MEIAGQSPRRQARKKGRGSMGRDYIPSSDTGFQAWEQNFIAYANGHLAALGLVAGDLTAIIAAQTAFHGAFTAHIAAQAAAVSARVAKDARRSELDGLLRPLVRRLQASPQVDDSERASMGITVEDGLPSVVPPAATRVVGVVDSSERLRHKIRFFDEATPQRRAKPAGVMGAEIWHKIGGEAPKDFGECGFLALDTASPYIIEFSGEDAGKTAYYMLRWVSTGGEKGPWSETIAATVGA